MPTFPTYRGELPQCLNPLKLRHYFLLAYWVYFRPTALKCYLFQADPDLYRTETGLGILRTWRVQAYRTPYLMIPGVIVLSWALVGVPLALVISWICGTPAPWQGWLWAAAFAATLSMPLSAMLGLVGGMIGGVTFGTALGIAFGIALGVPLGIAFTLYGTVSASYTAFLTALGVAAGMAIGMAGTVVAGVVIGMAFSVAFGMAGGIAGGATVYAAGSMAIAMGVLHALFYPLQLGASLWSKFRGGRHPLEWDELTVLPLPGMRQALARRLLRDKLDGLRFAADVVRNPFQRWAAQQALQTHLHDQAAPVHSLYTILAHPDLDVYVFAPVSTKDWGQLPSIKQVLLGEINGQWVDCSSDPANRLAERLVWAVTWLLRDRRRTPLTRFAGMLYELLDEEAVTADDFDLSAYAEIYTRLTEYPGGEEVARSFEALATFLSYDDLLDLAAAAGQDVILPHAPRDEPPVRPTVLIALARLGEIGAEIATYRDATSRVNQLAALARATDTLDALDEYIVAEVMAPEQYVLRRTIRQWRRLISEASGQAGRAEEVGPVANPYVAGNPVTGDLFVGRDDVLRRLEELWSGTGQVPSVVLYGHRRMGKSSILHNLGARFGLRTVVVDFNMQRVGLVENTSELLYNLALALYDAHTLEVSESPSLLDEPEETHFTDHNPYTAFDRFLKRLNRVREGHRFIVTVDEFELIEAMIAEGQLEPRLLDFWRGLIQTYPWFVTAFAGLHTLQEMTRDYWHPLYGSVTGIPVSFLSERAALRLITQPAPDFPLDYDQEAIEHIIALTHGQPYLVQLICHGLVTHYNRQAFEERVGTGLTFPTSFPISFERSRRLNLADVKTVINAPEFYRDGDAYFTGVWRQAETSIPPGQTTVLRALARSEAGMTADEIAREAGLALEEVRHALQTLDRHDVAMEVDGHWQFTVELMRRWVAQRGP